MELKVACVDAGKESWLMEGESQLARGKWPFCSWTRLGAVALLIWGYRAKSGSFPVGDVIWRKIHSAR